MTTAHAEKTHIIVRDSTALGRVIYEGGDRWSAYNPATAYRRYTYFREAEAMARGLGAGARAVKAESALAY